MKAHILASRSLISATKNIERKIELRMQKPQPLMRLIPMFFELIFDEAGMGLGPSLKARATALKKSLLGTMLA